MVFQKANFTRNMVVIVPYVAIAAGYAFAAICSILVRKDAPRSRARNLLASFIISGFFAGTIAPEVQRSSTLVSEAVRVGTIDIIRGDQVGQVRYMVLGLTLMLLMIFRPQGILGDRKEIALDAR
jgi:predicted lysophospholipase L1 biosynthesis ABC-type transport system permease subunit